MELGMTICVTSLNRTHHFIVIVINYNNLYVKLFHVIHVTPNRSWRGEQK